MSDEDRVCWVNEDCIAGYHMDEIECRFPSWADDAASPPADTESTGADVEALAEDLWADSPSPGAAPTEAGRDLARRFLASDWLAAHDAATADRVRRETAEGIAEAIDADADTNRQIGMFEVKGLRAAARIAREQAR